MATQVEAPLMPPPPLQQQSPPDTEVEERRSEGGKQEHGQDGEDGLGRKEFVEAPPPKVNPWIKASGGPVGPVNGQISAGGLCVCYIGMACVRIRAPAYV